MKNKFIKLLLSGFTVTLATLTLSSCASSTTSLFGIYATVDSDYNDTTMIKKDEGEVSANYSDIFKGFQFNNFGFSENSLLVVSNPTGSTYSSRGWQNFLFPLLNYTVSLSNLYNMDFSKNIDDLKNYEIISSSDNNLLEQFIYSWANVLSKGKETIRFGVTKVYSKITDPQKSFFPQASSTNNSDGTSSSEDKLTWDEKISDSGMYTFKSTNTFKIGFEFGYWNAAENNLTQPQSNLEDVKNMIKKTGSWGTFDVDKIKSNMWLTLSFDFSLTLAYSENDVIEKKDDTSSDANQNNHPDITWTEELKNKNIIPIFFFDSSDNKVNYKSSGDSIKEIFDLTNNDTYDSQKVNEIKNKYLKQLTLSENWLESK